MNDGGPAFPGEEGTSGYGNQKMTQGPNGPEWTSLNQGMSLRDWFAGQALAGMMACPNISDEDGKMSVKLAERGKK
jgi:hypothetical protein